MVQKRKKTSIKRTKRQEDTEKDDSQDSPANEDEFDKLTFKEKKRKSLKPDKEKDGENDNDKANDNKKYVIVIMADTYM